MGGKGVERGKSFVEILKKRNLDEGLVKVELDEQVG